MGNNGMNYLTAQHQTPPATVERNGLMHPTAPLIETEDTDALLELGIYLHVTADGDAPLGYTDWELDGTVYTREPAGTQEERDAATAANLRQSLSDQIDAQIPQISATQQAIDPLSTADVLRSASAASDRHMALDATDDAALGEFDPSLTVLNPGADAEYVRFAVSITEQEPWAGQPAGIYGFHAVVQPSAEGMDSGAEARLYVVDAPGDSTAVLPFTRVSSESGDYWECLSRDGFKWADPDLPVSVQLLWGAGSLPVSPVLTTPGAYQRVSCAVRYGTAVPTRVAP